CWSAACVCKLIAIVLVFFFSSRRRHTRSKRDWSSDVCSSDLILADLLSRSSVMVSVYEPAAQSICAVDEHGAIVAALRDRDLMRSEERRVGKECRSRLSR